MRHWKGIQPICFLTAALILCGACTRIISPSDREYSSTEKAVMAAAPVTTTAPAESTTVLSSATTIQMTTTTTTVTTTVTTTTTTVVTTMDSSLCAPFIDYAANIDPSKPMVALTFDDGPGGNTNPILDTLEAYQAHATFFVVGRNINADTGAVMQRAVSLGCEIGSHTYDHTDLTTLSPEQVQQELQQTDELVFEEIGRYPYWLRPPYGAFNDALQQTVEKPMAYWSVDTRDWKTRDTASTVDAALHCVEDGDIVLMHDPYTETAAAVTQIVPALVQQGYQLVTVSELTYYRGLEPQDGMIVFSMHPDDPNEKPAP